MSHRADKVKIYTIQIVRLLMCNMSYSWFKLKELTPWPAWLRHSVLTAAFRIACTFQNILVEKAADKCWFSSWYSLSQNVKMNIGVKDLISIERSIVLCQFSVCLPWQLWTWRHVFKTWSVMSLCIGVTVSHQYILLGLQLSSHLQYERRRPG